MSPDDPFLLFAYGTLMRGGVRHHFLAGQPFLGPGRTLPRYELLDLGDYPGLVPCPEGGRAVEGELYAVAGSLRGVLDAEEGAPSWFRLAPVALAGGGPAWAYFYQPEAGGVRRFPSARWAPRPGGAA